MTPRFRWCRRWTSAVTSSAGAEEWSRCSAIRHRLSPGCTTTLGRASASLSAGGVPAWLSGCAAPTGRAGTGSGASAEAVADVWSGPTPTRTTPSPVSSSRRSERGQPTQAVAGSRPAEVASTTAAITITTAQAAQPRRTQVARASSRSSYWRLAGCRSGSVAPTSHRVATVTTTSAETAVETERRFRDVMSNAFVCLRLHQTTLRLVRCQSLVHRPFAHSGARA